MSFGGHVIDMKNRYEQNRALMKARKERHNKIREAYMGHVTYKKHHLKERHLSKEELDIIKEKIRIQLRRDRIRSTTYTIIVTIVIAAIVTYFLYTRLFLSTNLINS